jgi:hypothetical protein
MSDALTVWLPLVLKVTLNVPLPTLSAALAGNIACPSELVICTVSFVVIKFQATSTALTVALKAVPAVCAVGVPLVPVGVPGTALSPGINSCSLVKTPGLTV